MYISVLTNYLCFNTIILPSVSPFFFSVFHFLLGATRVPYYSSVYCYFINYIQYGAFRATTVDARHTSANLRSSLITAAHHLFFCTYTSEKIQSLDPLSIKKSNSIIYLFVIPLVSIAYCPHRDFSILSLILSLNVTLFCNKPVTFSSFRVASAPLLPISYGISIL